MSFGLGRLGHGFGRMGAGSGTGHVIVLSATSISESASVNDVVGTLSVVNGSGTYTFSITADPDSKFQIANDDELQVADTLDYETDTSHLVTIEADNGVDDPISQQFTITVTNVPATLSDITGASTAATTADLLFIVSNEGNGVLYWVVTQSATAPTSAQIKAGLNHLGAAAVTSGTVAVSVAGLQTDEATGLTNAQSYYVHGVHTDGGGDDSNIDSSPQWTQGAAPIIADQGVTFGRETRDGAGGWDLVVTGGGATSFAITVDDGTNAGDWAFDGNNYLVPTQNGGLAASYTLTVEATNGSGTDTATITITTEADTYSVRTAAESDVVKALGAATLNNKTIKWRDVELANTDARISLAGLAIATGLMVTGDTNRGPRLPGFIITGSTNITLDGLRLHRLWESADGSGLGCVVRVGGAGHSVLDCEIWSNPLSGVTMKAGAEVCIGVGITGITFADDLTVDDNFIHDVYLPVRLLCAGLSYQRNTIEDCFQSFGECILCSDAVIKDNTGIGIWAHGGSGFDPGDPHSSLFGWTPGANSVDNVTFEGNIFLVGTNRLDSKGDYLGFATGPKMNDISGGNLFTNWKIRNNVLLGNGNIAFEFAFCEDSVFEHNFLGIDTDTEIQTTPGLNYHDIGTGCSARHNIFASFSEGAAGNVDASFVTASINNEVILSSGYSAKFDGATYTGVTIADVLTKFNPKAGSTMLTASPKIGAIGTGYYDFGTNTASYPAPTLSSPTDTATGETTGSGTVSSNESVGTLYWVVTTSASSPSAAQVKAGQDHTGAAAVDSGSQAVTDDGAQAVSFTGLTAATAYYAHYMHEYDARQSAVSSADGFTTDGAAAAVTLEWLSGQVDPTNRAGATTTFSTTGLDSGDEGKLAVVVVSIYSLTSGLVPTAVSVGGASATKRIGTDTDTNIDGSCSIWTVVVPSSPTDAVAITFGGNACSYSLFVLENAASAVPTDTFETKSASQGTTITGDIDTPEDGVLILGGFTINGAAGGAFTGSSTDTVDEHFDDDLEGGSGRIVSSSRSDGVAHTGETFTYTAVNSWHHIVGASFGP
jgi:hypothetical protein